MDLEFFNQKDWWMSRTIWTGIVTTVLPVLGAFGVLPESFDSTVTDEIVTVCLGVATIYFRATAKKAIAPVITPAPTA